MMGNGMVALVDCNSFFCSVEKVFHPGLWGKPVCVLSNNDGRIVALTPEAKAVGLHRGDPIFKVQDIVNHYGVKVFSGNMMLYAAMSKRVTNILRHSVLRVENYSIDESFCYLDGYDIHYDLTDYMRSVARKVKLWTDIPVSVGIAPSKTLAKMGSKFAKKYKGYDGVCLIDTDEKRRKALSMFDLADVWGIGRQTLQSLWVRSHFHKPGIQIWLELNGVPCIDTTEIHRSQTICTSRSFGKMVSDLPSLKTSVASFASSCTSKLRGQGSLARTVTVFLCSNRFREDLPQYTNCTCTTLAVPTSDTMEICTAALNALESIYRQGIQYKKSGVVLSYITTANPMQLDLFDPIQKRPQRTELMKSIDRLNQRYGLKTVQLAVEGEKKQAWKVKSERRSSNFLTDINEILTIRI